MSNKYFCAYLILIDTENHRILSILFSLEFVHTGDIESINSLLLKYAKKTHIYR